MLLANMGKRLSLTAFCFVVLCRDDRCLSVRTNDASVKLLRREA